MKLMRVLFSMLVLLFGLLVADIPKAFAEDCWCAMDERGYEYYIDTERTEYLKGGKYIVFVKQISPYDHEAKVLEWIFAFDEGVCWAYCKTDSNFTPPERKARNSELALSIIRFVYHYKYGDQYNSYID